MLDLATKHRGCAVKPEFHTNREFSSSVSHKILAGIRISPDVLYLSGNPSGKGFPNHVYGGTEVKRGRRWSVSLPIGRSRDATTGFPAVGDALLLAGTAPAWWPRSGTSRRGAAGTPPWPERRLRRQRRLAGVSAPQSAAVALRAEAWLARRLKSHRTESGVAFLLRQETAYPYAKDVSHRRSDPI